MPVKQRLSKLRTIYDEHCIAEILTLNPSLLPGNALYDSSAPGIRGIEKRDTRAIATAWREHEVELVGLWISAWRPESKFADYRGPGTPGSRPAGWWAHCAPVPRWRGETEPAYLDRTGQWQPREKEAWEEQAGGAASA